MTDKPITLSDDELFAVWDEHYADVVSCDRPPLDYELFRAIIAAYRALNATAQGMWQPIETAPKDGTPILGWCQHTADDYDGDHMTAYGARAEGLSHVEDGPHVLIWGDSYEVSDGWENPSFMMPAGWELSHDCEVMANPTHWMPLPATPTAPIPAVDAVSAGEDLIEWGNPIRIADIAIVPQRLDGKHTEYAKRIAAALASPVDAVAGEPVACDAALFRFLLEHCMVEDENGCLAIRWSSNREPRHHPMPERLEWIRGDLEQEAKKVGITTPPRAGSETTE
jgi:hypothetical protein